MPCGTKTTPNDYALPVDDDFGLAGRRRTAIPLPTTYLTKAEPITSAAAAVTAGGWGAVS